MVERRDLLRAMTGFAAGAVVPVSAAPPPVASGMKHRSYSGKMLYSKSDAGETGRETFTVTIQPNGLRTMRAMCEMDPEQLLRDVSLTVDREWNPVVGFVQLTLQQQFLGAAWYHFDDRVAECEGFNTQLGRFEQRFPLGGPANTFGAHPVHCDGWKLARVRKFKGDLTKMNTGAFTTSTAPLGASGPSLVPVPADRFTYAYVGREQIKVHAGTFATEHFRFTVNGIGAVADIWAHGEDCVPIRMVSANSKQAYELVELNGNYL